MDPCERTLLDRLQEIRQEREIDREREKERRESENRDIHSAFCNYLSHFLQNLPQEQSAILMRDIKQLMRQYEPF